MVCCQRRRGGAAPQPTAEHSTVRANSERLWEVELRDGSGVLARGDVLLEDPRLGRPPTIQNLRAVPRLVD